VCTNSESAGIKNRPNVLRVIAFWLVKEDEGENVLHVQMYADV